MFVKYLACEHLAGLPDTWPWILGIVPIHLSLWLQGMVAISCTYVPLCTSFHFLWSRIHLLRVFAMGSTDNTSLGDLVESKFKSNTDGKNFLPLDEIDHLVGSSAARAALEAAGFLSPGGHENFIRGNSKRLFLIVALMDDMPLLQHLREHHVDDSFLPLTFTKDERGYYCRKIGRDESTRRHWFCKSWTRSQCKLFEGYMWQLMAPSFGPHTKFRRDFCTDDILPFLKREKSVAHGFFGDVFKTTIHKGHLNSSLWPEASQPLDTSSGC